MQCVSIKPRPEPQCIEPTICFDVEFEFTWEQELLLDCAMTVSTEDRKLLGVAHPITFGLGNPGYLAAAAPADKPTTSHEGVALQLSLSPRQLDYLEGLRSKHRKRDVVLTCAVQAQYLVSKVVNATLKVGPPLNETSKQKFVLYEDTERVQTNYTNMWVLSGDRGRTFLERRMYKRSLTVTIGSGDWLHDYAAPWRSTRYLVVELPQPEILTSTPSVEQRLNAAIEEVRKAEEDLAREEYSGVLEDLRPVWELLRNDADIQALLEMDGYTPEAVKAFNESVKQQFDLASKFVHRIDKSGKRVMPEIRAGKEDAHLCFSFALSLLNLVARKAQRLG